MMIWDRKVDQPKEVQEREVVIYQLFSQEVNHIKELMVMPEVRHHFQVNKTNKLFKQVSHMFLSEL
jgi:hypothetical protein